MGKKSKKAAAKAKGGAGVSSAAAGVAGGDAGGSISAGNEAEMRPMLREHQGGQGQVVPWLFPALLLAVRAEGF